jgi:hypothetical protein
MFGGVVADRRAPDGYSFTRQTGNRRDVHELGGSA